MTSTRRKRISTQKLKNSGAKINKFNRISSHCLHMIPTMSQKRMLSSNNEKSHRLKAADVYLLRMVTGTTAALLRSF